MARISWAGKSSSTKPVRPQVVGEAEEEDVVAVDSVVVAVVDAGVAAVAVAEEAAGTATAAIVETGVIAAGRQPPKTS